MKRFLLFLCLVLTGAVTVQATGEDVKAAEARTPEELVQNLYLVLKGDKPADEIKALFISEADFQVMGQNIGKVIPADSPKRDAYLRQIKTSLDNYGQAAQKFLSDYQDKTVFMDIKNTDTDTKFEMDFFRLNCVIVTDDEERDVPLACIKVNGVYKLIGISELTLDESGNLVFPSQASNQTPVAAPTTPADQTGDQPASQPAEQPAGQPTGHEGHDH